MATRQALTVLSRTRGRHDVPVGASKTSSVVSRTRDHQGRLWWSLLALGLVAAVFGGVSLMAQTANGSGSKDAGVVPVQRAARTNAAELAARLVAKDSVVRAAPPQAPPARLRLPRLEIDAPVQPVSVRADGLLGVPENPRQLGWWSASGRPGMSSASVVIDGHVDSATLGLGAFFRLHEAQPGDKILLRSSAGGSTQYTVVGRRSYPKASLPVAEVFARDVGPRLVLITCGGRFDQATGHYADNVVVYAVPR